MNNDVLFGILVFVDLKSLVNFRLVSRDFRLIIDHILIMAS